MLFYYMLKFENQKSELLAQNAMWAMLICYRTPRTKVSNRLLQRIFTGKGIAIQGFLEVKNPRNLKNNEL